MTAPTKIFSTMRTILNPLRISVVAGCLSLVGSAPAIAQTKEDQSSSQYTELLDLITEPVPNSNPISPSPSPPDFDGEDIGAAPAVSLETVRQSMLSAAESIHSDIDLKKAARLQEVVVRQLDELISQRNSSTSQSDLRQSDEETRSSKQSQTPEQSSGVQSQESADSDGPSQQESNGQNESNSPGQTGNKADIRVRLADPVALQRNIWGQLPQRVRKQMQSRMVEQFLPSYRRQIEEYFQALLSDERL